MACILTDLNLLRQVRAQSAAVCRLEGGLNAQSAADCRRLSGQFEFGKLAHLWWSRHGQVLPPLPGPPASAPAHPGEPPVDPAPPALVESDTTLTLYNTTVFFLLNREIKSPSTSPSKEIVVVSRLV